MLIVGVGSGTVLLLMIALGVAFFYFRQKGFGEAPMPALASMPVQQTAWGSPSFSANNSMNGFAGASPPMSAGYNGNGYGALPAEQMADRAVPPGGIPFNAQYTEVMPPHAQGTATSSTPTPEVITDPYIEAIMRQAQMGLFMLQGKESEESAQEA